MQKKTAYLHIYLLPHTRSLFYFKINVHFQPDNRQPLCVITTQHVLKSDILHLQQYINLVSKRHQKNCRRLFFLHILLCKKDHHSHHHGPHHTHFMSSSFLKNAILPWCHHFHATSVFLLPSLMNLCLCSETLYLLYSIVGCVLLQPHHTTHNSYELWKYLATQNFAYTLPPQKFDRRVRWSNMSFSGKEMDSIHLRLCLYLMSTFDSTVWIPMRACWLCEGRT